MSRKGFLIVVTVWVVLIAMSVAQTKREVLALPSRMDFVEVFQQGHQGYTGATDTYLVYEDNTSHGSEQFLYLLGGGTEGAIVSLLRFDVSRLPPNTRVTSATLALYCYYIEREALPDFRGYLYCVKRPWDEGSATWYMATATTWWTLPGCAGPGTDRCDPANDTTDLYAGGAPEGKWFEWDVTELVQQWVDDPWHNFGVVIKSNTGPYWFPSSNSAMGFFDQRPKLTVHYVLHTPTPTATQTNTSTPTRTPTVTRTLTLTPTPTLSTGTIRGMVCEDLNANGVCDTGEPPLPAATIRLWDAQGVKLSEIITLSDGLFVFSYIPPGQYTVEEIDPPGYTSYPDQNRVEVYVAAGTVTTVNFADRRLRWLYLPIVCKN
ncbi:MAG: DNRLRE domain-containing protein [Chloroflexi bacterium]|nr:DNRLRE domain-containing protein [Chloroflexota bacterium]